MNRRIIKMISKIIQKEKERQEKYLSGCGIAKANPYKHDKVVILCGRDEERCHECIAKQLSHKQSLINLKEYMEEKLVLARGFVLPAWIISFEKDIQELNKMIESYKWY